MKLFGLQHNYRSNNNSFRNPFDSSSIDPNSKSPSTLFWLFLHCLCCLISLVLGFRFSRLILYLLISTTTNFTVPPPLLTTTTTTNGELHIFQKPHSVSNLTTNSRVVVGRHGILIRPWPHPNPTQVMKAHRIIERVQNEQRVQFGIINPKPIIVITPTYVRTFQTLHLTGLIHSLMLVPYHLIWIVVEAGGTSNETSTLLANSGLHTIHIGFEEKMPISWVDRHRMEARMRLRALRVVREERLDGIVMFGDDSNMHSMELFDEIQLVKWVGSVSIGILHHSENLDEQSSLPKKQDREPSSPMPVQGPACNSSGTLVGWHTYSSLSYPEKSSTYIGEGGMVLPNKLEWAGFVMNSRLVWQGEENKPYWVRDLDTLAEDRYALDSPLSLLKDASFVEPLGDCGRKVMLWWLRVEARADSKFPPGWIIKPPLEITVPAKRSPWPDSPSDISSDEKVIGMQDYTNKRHVKLERTSGSRDGPRDKRKHEGSSKIDEKQ